MEATRRSIQRANTLSEIKRAALDQIERKGAASLGMREIGRSIGMSPAGLYRYFDGRDALLTELVADAYNDLATAVESAIAEADGGTTSQVIAGIRRYREWAQAQPSRFLLIFGTPVPGYRAPEAGPTVVANTRLGAAFFSLAWEQHAGEGAGAAREATAGELKLAQELKAEGLTIDSSQIPLMLGTWAHWHGLVMLEVTNQFAWIYPTDMDVFFEGELSRMIEALTH